MPIAVVAPRWVSTATACSAISAAASAPGGSGRSYRNPISTRWRGPLAPITTKLSCGWNPSRCGTTASMSAGPLTRTRGRASSGSGRRPGSPGPDGGLVSAEEAAALPSPGRNGPPRDAPGPGGDGGSGEAASADGGGGSGDAPGPDGGGGSGDAPGPCGGTGSGDASGPGGDVRPRGLPCVDGEGSGRDGWGRGALGDGAPGEGGSPGPGSWRARARGLRDGCVVSMDPGSCAGRTGTRLCHTMWTMAPQWRALSTAGIARFDKKRWSRLPGQ